MQYTTLAVLLLANPTLLAACERANRNDSMETEHAPGQPRPVGSDDPTVNVQGAAPAPNTPVVSPTGNRMELAAPATSAGGGGQGAGGAGGGAGGKR